MLFFRTTPKNHEIYLRDLSKKSRQAGLDNKQSIYQDVHGQQAVYLFRCPWNEPLLTNLTNECKVGRSVSSIVMWSKRFGCQDWNNEWAAMNNLSPSRKKLSTVFFGLAFMAIMPWGSLALLHKIKTLFSRWWNKTLLHANPPKLKPVWPNVGIKSSQNFPRVATEFCLKNVFQNIPKSHQIICQLIKENLMQKNFKITRLGHTGWWWIGAVKGI